MYHHRLTVSYKGTHYFGWQETREEKPSIEATIHQVLRKICKYQDCSVSASSRTDAGVHAQGQVLKVTLPIKIDSDKLLLGMNSLLAEDIRVLQCEPSSKAFNPNTDSKSKLYHYHFYTESIHKPLLNDIVVHVPISRNILLDISLIQKACKLFIGEHDFYSFAKRDNTKSSTIRNIISCEVIKADSFSLGQEIYTIKIVGQGFLRYMIRYIAGALFAVARGEISLNEISNALLTKKEEKLTPRAKARGLHLMEVRY